MATNIDAAVMNPQAGAGRPLPKKEADIFKNLVKHYETKQYKKAIKQADLIMKKFPNHGETLAMKGLTLNYMSKRDEAHELVKEGLRNDLRSHVCWHVLGLLHRSDRNYAEAIKAYKQALRIDPNNNQILRDLSFLQIQMRDLEGFAVSRNTLLTLKPSIKINWMAFALARHLAGDLEGALKVIDTYLSTLTEESSELGRCYESSELALYRNTILAEMPGSYQQALEHLGVIEGIVVDRGAWFRKKAEYQLKLRDFAAAQQSVMLMFRRGMTEDYQTHSLYMCALLGLEDDNVCTEALQLKGTRTLATMMPLTDEQKTSIREAYAKDLGVAFPKSHAIQRIPMSIMEGDDLRKALDGRCRTDLPKGVPSLCSELYSFLLVEKDGRYTKPSDPVDIRAHPVFQMIVDLVSGYVVNLEGQKKFSPDDETEQDSSTILWAWFLRAGLHHLAGEYSEGIALLDKCLEHTPAMVDVSELKARILLAAGDIQAAVVCLDKGRELDLQDRYINNQTTNYMLKAGMEEEALKRISLFTRHEGNPEQNLFDMQCSWYELELADCLAKKSDWGRSLKKYSAVVKHFDDFYEDQFDFHAYCLRKVTLRSYVSALRFEDEVYGQEYYCRAAAGAIRIFLHLFDNPEQQSDVEPDYSKMTAAEKKKAKAIARKKKKAAEKKEADAQGKRNAEEANNKKNQKGAKPADIDEDPLGKELLKKDPVVEATKYSAMLTQYAPNRLQTWILRYDVAIRRKKALMCLQALNKAKAIDAASDELFTRIVDFAGKMEGFADLNDVAKTVLDEEAPKVLDGLSREEFVEAAADRVRGDPLTDLPMRIAVAQTLFDLSIGSAQDAASLVTSGGVSCKKFTVEACFDALTTLKRFGSDVSDVSKEWASKVNAAFPLASNLSYDNVVS